ncbi:hypothetical protein N2152v2_001924 [Parachlorella kessleri]
MGGCDSAVLVEVRGPDAKLARASAAPFHAGKDGTTALSTSGFVLEGHPAYVLTTVAAIYPYLTSAGRQNLPSATHASLVPAASIRGYLNGERVPLRLLGVAEAPGVQQALSHLLSAPSVAGSGAWRVGFPPQPHSQRQPLHDKQGGQRFQWQQQPAVGSLGTRLAAYVAVLVPEVSQQEQGSLKAAAVQLSSAGHLRTRCRRGAPVRAVGAPFGALGPHHFNNFVSTGIVSNWVPRQPEQVPGPAASSPEQQCMQPALLALDLRCLPGMEGGPVFDPIGQVIGMLAPPLMSSTAQAQLALAIPADALAAAVSAVVRQPRGAASLGSREGVDVPGSAACTADDHGVRAVGLAAPTCGLAAAAVPAAAPPGLASHQGGAPFGVAPGACDISLGFLRQALGSIVAVATGASWASGVIVTPQGHVLTNAHLFEPRGHLPQAPLAQGPAGTAAAGTAAAGSAAAAAGSSPPRRHPPTARVLVRPPPQLQGQQALGQGLRRPTWHTAQVLHVFRGPLDLAVLQLRSPGKGGDSSVWDDSVGLYAASSGASTCSAGSKDPCHGPYTSVRQQEPQQEQREGKPPCCSRAGPWPAIHLAGEPGGVDCRRARGGLAGQPAAVCGFPLFNPAAGLGPWVVRAGDRPAQLLTTACVHSGASGGAVLDPRSGRLLGLVTSNAKQSSGMVYPHLNFSIPTSLLRPVCALAAQQGTLGETQQGAGAWAALDAELARDAALCTLWGLSFGAGQDPGGEVAPGGPFGGARPPQALTKLLDKLGKEGAGQQGCDEDKGEAAVRSKL